MFLKQSTAYTFRHGPFIDDTDGKTAETGLTISQADVRLSKAGGNFAQKNESSASSHDEIGYYIVVLDATDTNTCGELLVVVHEAGALPVFKTFQVLEETIYDSLFATSAAAFDANQRVDVAKIKGSDATDQINAACDTAMSDYDAPTKAEMDTAHGLLATEAKQDIIDANVDQIEAAVITNAAGADIAADVIALKAETAAIVADSNELQGDWENGGRLDILVDSIISKVDVVDATCDSILVDTAVIGVSGAGLTDLGGMSTTMKSQINTEADSALSDYDPPTKAELDAGIAGLNDISTAQVNTEVDTALADIHLDHLLAADYDPASKPGTATALLNELIESDGGVSRFTVNALEQGPSGSGGDATEAKQDQIIAAVITNAAGTDISADIIAVKAETATIVTDTTELQTDDVPGLISALNNISTADVNTQCDLSLSDYDAPTKAEMDSAFSTTDAKIDAVDNYIDTEISAIKSVTDAIPNAGSMSSIATASALTTVSGKIDTIDTVVDANSTKIDTLVADSPGRPAKGVALAGFPFLLVASSDHVTGKTGATVTATRSLDGAAFAACANTATEVGSGIYKVDLASSDLDADTVVLKFTATDADTRYVTIVTQAT